MLKISTFESIQQKMFVLLHSDCFRSLRYFRENFVTQHFLVQLYGHIMKGAADDQHVSNSYVGPQSHDATPLVRPAVHNYSIFRYLHIHIKGLPQLDQDSKVQT